MTKLALLLAILCGVLTVGTAHAQTAPVPPAAARLSPPTTVLQVAPEGPHWNAEREAWYRRNRAITISGKVAAIIGVATVFTSVFMDNFGGEISGIVLEYGGLLAWSGCDLKATNRFRSWGFRIHKAAAIVSVVGVFTATPATIVAGSIQSARIRELHREAAAGTMSSSARVLGAGLRLSF